MFVGYVWVVLITIFLVIIAGSIVRSTQSGMGCPDWPTCFGSAIPPTDANQVIFHPNQAYKKGQFIIYHDSLKYAKQQFLSGKTYDPKDWKQYEKHNYAQFTVEHTWIEYLNRLLGALLGLLVLALFVWGFWQMKVNRSIVWLSFGLVLLTGFQAWLGKTVVDSNLALLKITLHMLGALAMVFLCIYILFLAKGKKYVTVPKKAVQLSVVLASMVMLQLLLGTEVRGQIDQIAEHNKYINRSGWVAALNVWFYIHRSFSLLIGGLAVYLLLQLRLQPLAAVLLKRVVAIIILEILVGVVLAYLDFPQAAQPIHLLLSSVLIALLFTNLLKLKAGRS